MKSEKNSKESTINSIKREVWKERRKRSRQASQWLCERFPQAFDVQHPKPLKVGILKDVLALKVEGLSRSSLQMAIFFYTSRWTYLESIIQGDQRFDLDGGTAGLVEESHKKDARRRLKKRKNAFDNNGETLEKDGSCKNRVG